MVCDKRIDVNIYRSHSRAMLSVRLQLQTSHELGIITSPSAYVEFERASPKLQGFQTSIDINGDRSEKHILFLSLFFFFFSFLLRKNLPDI